MYKVHRLVERRTTLNSRKWENNKTFIYGNIFKIVERTNAWNNKVIDTNLVNVVIYKIDISKSESLKYKASCL